MDVNTSQQSPKQLPEVPASSAIVAIPSLGSGFAQPSYPELLDERNKPQRIVDFLHDLDHLHQIYRQINLRTDARGNNDQLRLWASEIGRTHFNPHGGIPLRPVGAQRVHMLEVLSQTSILNTEIVQELLMQDVAQPALLQNEKAYEYACHLVAQIKHSSKLDEAGKFVAFPCHFEPGAGLLAMRNWAHAFTKEEFESGVKLLGPILNWWYG